MYNIIKTNTDLVLNSKNKLELIKKLWINDEIYFDKKYKILDFKESVRTPYRINTVYSLPFYGYSNTLIKSREQYDFDEAYEYTSIPLSKLKESDLVYLPYHSSVSDLKFNIGKYLYKDKYNYSIIKQELINKLKLPSWFLFTSLLCGVPEEENYNEQLNTYIKNQGYSSIEEFRDTIIEQNCNRFSKSLPICKGILNLLILSLTNNIKFTSHLNVELNIDTDLYPEMLKELTSFLVKNKFNFKISNNIYVKETVIKINSSLLYLMLKDSFDNYSILFRLTSINSKYILSRLFSKYLISFSFKDQNLALAVQHYLLLNKLLFNIEITEESYILTPLSPDLYISLDTGFLLPITSIEEISDTLIELQLQKIEV